MSEIKQNAENQIIIDNYDYIKHSSVLSECTGLIPSAPMSTEELESYQAMYPFEPPQVKPQKDIK
ncbi:MAG: hypothetical protein RSA90_00845 [Lachnospiraceae bacterium]